MCCVRTYTLFHFIVFNSFHLWQVHVYWQVSGPVVLSHSWMNFIEQSQTSKFMEVFIAFHIVILLIHMTSVSDASKLRQVLSAKDIPA